MHFFERVTCTYCRYLAARSYASAVQSSSVTSALIADSPPNDGAKPKISRRKARSPSLSVVQKSRLSNQQAGTSAQTLTETLLAIHENASTLEKIDSSHVQDISTENAGSFTRKQLGSISTRRIARRKRPIKAKASISAKRKAKTTAEVDGINLGSIEAIGKDGKRLNVRSALLRIILSLPKQICSLHRFPVSLLAFRWTTGIIQLFQLMQIKQRLYSRCSA